MAAARGTGAPAAAPAAGGRPGARERGSGRDRTGWLIEQACPQCGAPVTLQETDRLLVCPFCRVRLFVTAPGPFHVLIPPAAPAAGAAPAGDLLYVPYWRFKGQVYACLADRTRSGLLDMTSRAAAVPGLPATLGVRPQSMTLRFAGAGDAASLAAVRVTREEAFAACWAAYQALHEFEAREAAFVGETVSLVYTPVRIGAGIHDAVAGRRLAPLPAEGVDRAALLQPAARLELRFLPTLCPGCGWDLEAERESLVLFCRHCGSAWGERGGELARVACEVLRVGWKPDAYLPFWRTKASVEGLPLRTVADLVRVANLPRMVRTGEEERELAWWTPAFKVHPEHYVRFGRALTVRQPEEVTPADPVPAGTYPVTLAASEIGESLKVLLVEMVTPRRRMLFSPEPITVRPRSSSLVLVPFLASRNELANPELSLLASPQLLAYGRNL